MSYNTRVLERIERAQDERPYCPACGRPTAVIERDGELWLACTSERPASRLGGLLHTLAAHHAELVVNRSEQATLAAIRRSELRLIGS